MCKCLQKYQESNGKVLGKSIGNTKKLPGKFLECKGKILWKYQTAQEQYWECTAKKERQENVFKC